LPALLLALKKRLPSRPVKPDIHLSFNGFYEWLEATAKVRGHSRNLPGNKLAVETAERLI
jgi:hypothetical protein